MSDYIRIAIVFVAAVNPASAALSLVRQRAGATQPARTRAVAPAIGFAVAVLLFAAAAGAASRLLDLLEVEPETFRIGAGIVMLISGAAALVPGLTVTGEAAPGWRAGIYPLGLPGLAGAAGLVAAVSYSADEGFGMAFGAAVPALALGAGLAGVASARWRPGLQVAATLLGALLVALAVALIVSGVRDI